MRIDLIARIDVRTALILKLLQWLVNGIILVSLMAGMETSASQKMLSQPEMRSLIIQAKDAWVARDAAALTQLFTANGQLIVPGQRWQGQAQIQAEVAKFARAYTDVSITIYRIIIDLDGDDCVEGRCQRAAVEWHYQDTEIATGKRSRSDDAIAIEVQNGRISYWREYFDPSGN